MENAISEEVTVIKNKKVGSNFYVLELKNTPLPFVPGQFVMLSVSDFNYPILKRPFAIAGKRDDGYNILYRVAGEGTKLLSRVAPGTRLEMIFPLGNGFKWERGTPQLIVAGGTGIASVMPLVEYLKEEGTKFVFIAGFRSRSDGGDLIKLLESNYQAVICTNDGSHGMRGTAIDMATKYVKEFDSVILCGPLPMVRAFKEKFPGIKSSVSLERHMGCGTGVCLGCVVDTVKGIKRVCREGPVFPLEEIKEL